MILRTYREVVSALRDPSLQITGGSVDAVSHRAMREQARRLYPPHGYPELTAHAQTIVDGLAAEVELTADLAEPWALRAAAVVTGLDTEAATRLRPSAQIVFDAGASLPGEVDASAATALLASHFAPQEAALHTQAFVALAVSVPAFLGNAFLALLQNPEQFEAIGEPGAMDELLRFGGPSLIQRRMQGTQLVELHLAEANRDAAQFPDPERLDLRRDASGHVAFGGGAHACVGGPLVKALAAPVLPIFAARFKNARLVRFAPYGGPAIRGHRVYVV
jgi:hypothetical protein